MKTNEVANILPFRKFDECAKNSYCDCTKCARWTAEAVEQQKGDVVFEKLQAQFGVPYNSGSTRIVFKANDQFVIKFPRNHSGKLGNEKEARMNGQTSRWGIPTPKGWLEHVNGVPILWQEVVHPVDIRTLNDHPHKYPLPDWTDQLEDGLQIGYTNDGRLVCYDFGYEDE
jgi:hypothetical protein